MKCNPNAPLPGTARIPYDGAADKEEVYAAAAGGVRARGPYASTPRRTQIVSSKSLCNRIARAILKMLNLSLESMRGIAFTRKFSAKIF